MAIAPVPTPQYIDYATNVQPMIGNDKILVSDTEPNAIPVSEANALIAQGEMEALWDLSPYYVTAPALITTIGEDWTTLQSTYPATYKTLYNMFVYKACLDLVTNFIARNTDEEGRTLSYFQKAYAHQYNQYHNRIVDSLKNGSYRYLLAGLQTLDTGIQRKPARYSRGIDLGADNYVDRQLTNPRLNYDVWWGVG